MHSIFNLKPKKLSIDLEPGLYAFDDISASGKTYLMGLLNALNELEQISVCNITYKKDICIENVINEINKKTYDVIFFDRMDLYITRELCDAISVLPKETIVLMDIKDLNLLYKIGVNIADIELKENIIEVK
jgi:hypothetical protein